MSEHIVPKVGWFWRTLDVLVRIVTLGQSRRFLEDYWTTIGETIGYPAGVDPHATEHAPVLAHERVHIAQQRRLGFGSVWLGLVPWGIAYLLLPLPVGLAYFRYRWEREAYAVGYRAELERMRTAGASGTQVLARRAYLIQMATEQLTTGAYLWCWPWPAAVRRWLEGHI